MQDFPSKQTLTMNKLDTQNCTVPHFCIDCAVMPYGMFSINSILLA